VEGAAAGRTERAGGAAGTGERAADDAAGAGERTGSRAGEAVEQGFLSERKLTNALGEDHEIHILLDGSITRCSAVCEAIAFNLGKRADALPEAMQKEGRLLVKQAEQNQRNSINAAASGIPDKDRMLQLDAIAERSATLEQKMSQLEQRAGLAGVRPQPPFARTPQELQDLARDPANKFLVDAKSQHEAAVGLDLESKNVLQGPIRRDIQPDRAEFIDINGTPWDMKSFQSATFDEKTALAQIQAELNKGENVILDLKDLNPTHQKALRDAFAATPAWNGHVVFWP
jgi:hypothetical protein